jgi:ubiquinone biosynthesis protein
LPKRWAVIIGFFQILLTIFFSRAVAGSGLPTPSEHYADYNPQQAALQLMGRLMPELDPSTRAVFMTAFGGTKVNGKPGYTRAEMRAALKKIDLKKWKPDLLELFVHQSNVLDAVPSNSRNWVPVFHDGLILFLDGLNEDRLVSSLADFYFLPANATRGDRIIQFASRTPTLQKLGQIFARNPELPPDIQKSLQTLESGIRTSTREELVDFIKNELGASNLQRYQIQFAPTILAEASVGAILKGSMKIPESGEGRDVVFKIIKPYVLKNLPEELAVFDQVTGFFQKNMSHFAVGNIPLADLFHDIRTALSKEIQISQEEENLGRAWEYYRNNPKIQVPKPYPISTAHVIVMDFVTGEKISSSFPSDPAKRRIMAKRLSEVLTSEVVFSSKGESLFHGDPHAGNIFHVLGDQKDPYKIGLLDWGMSGMFPRAQRMELVQLFLGVYLGDFKRLRNNVTALIEGSLPNEPYKRAKIDLAVKETINNRKVNTFDSLGDLIMRLTKEGYKVKFNISTFIKSQVTIAGILKGLDPDFKQDDVMMHRASRLAKRELPLRFLNTLWIGGWNSHGYQSLLSNEDVKDALFRKKPIAAQAN